MIKKAVFDYLSGSSEIKELLGNNPNLILNSNKFEIKAIPQVVYYASSPQMQSNEEELYAQDFNFEVYADSSITGNKIIVALINLMNVFSKGNCLIVSDDNNLIVRSVWLQNSFMENTFNQGEKVKYTNSVGFRVVYSWSRK
jgi:hypothetical protein